MSIAIETLRAAFKVGEALAPKQTARLAVGLFFTPRKRRTKERLERVPLDEGNLPTGYFRRWSDGKPVFMIHGWEGSFHQFHAMIRSLETRGFGAITLDPPAHGSAPGRQSDPRKFSDTLISAQERLGPAYAAIGHSLGGLALMLALRDGLLLNAAVLISTPSSPQVPIRDFENLVGLGSRTRSHLRSMIAARVGEDHVSLHARHLINVNPPKGLIVHDDNDRRIPASHAREIALAWPTSSVVRTAGLGHNRILDGAISDQVADWLQTFTQDQTAAE